MFRQPRTICLTLMLLCAAPVLASEGAASMPSTQPATAPTRYEQQLARECDALIERAVQRPYGWAWANQAVDDQPEPEADAKLPPGQRQAKRQQRLLAARRAPIEVALRPDESPAAAILLLRAGQLLHEEHFTTAGINAARGLAADAAKMDGRIGRVSLFGATPGTDPAGEIADRAPTCAGLACMMIAMNESAGEAHDFLQRSAARSARWLVGQQGENGAWLTAWPVDSAAKTDDKKPRKIARLDDGDFAHCTEALLLARQGLSELPLERGIDHSLDFLLRLRLDPNVRLGAYLWATAYNPDASVVQDINEFPPAVDTVACRDAMQSLLAIYLFAGDDHTSDLAGDALSRAATPARKLPLRDGQHARLYDPFGAPHTPAAPPPFAFGQDPSTHPVPIDYFQAYGEYGLTPILQSTPRIIEWQTDGYLQRLNALCDWKIRLALAICGLSDQPLTLDLPTTAADVPGYLEKHAAEFATLNDPPPADLHARVRRLYLLVLRVEMERLGSRK